MMKPMGSCDGTSEYLGVCDAINGYVRCDDAGEVVRSKLFLGHFERHKNLYLDYLISVINYKRRITEE